MVAPAETVDEGRAVLCLGQAEAIGALAVMAGAFRPVAVPRVTIPAQFGEDFLEGAHWCPPFPAGEDVCRKDASKNGKRIDR
jgi:hypothetical protein